LVLESWPCRNSDNEGVALGVVVVAAVGGGADGGGGGGDVVAVVGADAAGAAGADNAQLLHHHEQSALMNEGIGTPGSQLLYRMYLGIFGSACSGLDSYKTISRRLAIPSFRGGSCRRSV
jgi:hypothetical protein